MLASFLLLAILGAAPTAVPTPEQDKVLQEMVRLWRAGLKARKEGKEDEAIRLVKRALQKLLPLCGPYDDGIPILAGNLAAAHQRRGEWADEAECRRLVLVARGRLDGPGHWKTTNARLALEEALAQPKRTPAQREALRKARVLDGQVSSLHAAGKAAQAVRLARQALALREGVLDKKHPLRGRALSNLAVLLGETGAREEALRLHREALAIHKAALGEEHPYYADSLHGLAVLYQNMGDHKAALPLYQKALDARKKSPGKGRLDLAVSLDNFGLFLQEMGDLKAALPMHEQALAIRKAALGEKHQRYAFTLNNIAILHARAGDLKAALALHEKAAAALKDALGPRHLLYSDGLDTLALMHQRLGDFKAALPLHLKALEIKKAAFGERHPRYATSLANLALLRLKMGDFKVALPLHEKVIEITREALGEGHPYHAVVLNNLAALRHRMGDHKAARPLYEKALAIREAALGDRHPDYAQGLNNLAVLLRDMHEHRAALPLQRKALALQEATLGKRHPLYASSLDNLATLLHEMGRSKDARPLYEKSLALRKAVLGERHPEYAMGLNNFAMMLNDTGDDRAALVLMEKALSSATARLREEAAVLSPRQQLDGSAALRRFLDNRLRLPDLKGHTEAAAHVLAWKGAVLLRERQRRLFVRLVGDPEARRAAQRLQDVTGRLAALRLSTTATRKQVEELEAEQDAAEAELSRQSDAFRASKKETSVTPEQLAKALPKGAVLVDYLFHGPPGRQLLTAFIHRPGKAPVRVFLGKAAPVVRAALAWRALLMAGKPEGATGQAVKRLILAPLEKHLEGAKMLLISPDGVLGTVPFAALPGSKAGTYLIEGLAVAVVPAPAVVPQLLRPVPEKGRLSPSLLVVGGVDYDGGAAPPGGRRKWIALPATTVEAESAAASFSGAFKGGKVVRLSKADATSGAVRTRLPEARFAHLATHGYFAPEEVKSAGPARGSSPVGWPPLLLSGLVFAGANREDGGILTALEVSELDLTRLELAVLSACETGLGEEAGGEGLLGLQRAFAAAGARTVVSSLWSVHDAATAVLMERFYHHLWEKKAGTLEALRQAQLDVMGHPEWVETRMTKLAGMRGLRAAGKTAEVIVAGKRQRRSPPAWWAAFVLSGA
jgi:CHAT domain-containing protein/tetratricopeptide (TPR) repeat protein